MQSLKTNTLVLVGGMVKPSEGEKMKDVLFSVTMGDEPLKAVPVSNIKEFTVGDVEGWSPEAKREWLEDYNYGYYFVRVAYTICTGCHEIVFTSDSKSDCIDFIYSIYE